MEEQIRRISQMEEILQTAKGAVQRLDAALEEYEALLEPLRVLDAYYGSREWLQDLDDDRDGKLPADLKRGVLSEDEIYDLLTEARELARRMTDLAARPFEGERED